MQPGVRLRDFIQFTSERSVTVPSRRACESRLECRHKTELKQAMGSKSTELAASLLGRK